MVSGLSLKSLPCYSSITPYYFIMELNALTAISAVDGRYRKQVQHLDEYFSEFALIKYRVLIEIEYLYFLSNKKFFKLSTNAVKHLNSIKEDFLIGYAEE